MHYLQSFRTYIKILIPGADSKIAARGRKQKVYFLKKNLGEMLEIHLTGKTTRKRQNLDSSTSPAHA
jgi:hypothetical protein